MTGAEDNQAQPGQALPELAVPLEVTRGPLPATPEGTPSASDNEQPASPRLQPSPKDIDARERFTNSVHQYVREYIQFADQKATFLFTGATALLAFLYTKDVSARWLKPIMQWNILDTISFVAMAALAIGVILAVLVVVPRTTGSRRGFFFWEAIAEYGTGRQYSDEIGNLSPATLVQITAEHCFDLARTCRRKYQILRYAMVAGAIGLVASVAVFLFAGRTAT